MARSSMSATVLLLAGFSALCLAPPAAGQRPERVGADAVWHPRAEGKEEGSGISIRQVGVKGGHSVWTGERGRLMLGGEFRATSFAAEQTAPWPDVDVYETSLAFDYRRVVTSNLAWSVMLAPGLATDFESVTSDAFRMKSLGLLTYQSAPEWRWVGGVYYGQAFGESRVFPAAGVFWRPTREWSVNLIMPRPAVTYAPTRAWAFTALVQPAGADWSIEHEGRRRELILETWRGGCEASWRPNPGMSIDVQAGGAFARRIELRDGNDDIVKGDIDTVPYVRVGLRLFEGARR